MPLLELQSSPWRRITPRLLATDFHHAGAGHRAVRGAGDLGRADHVARARDEPVRPPRPWSTWRCTAVHPGARGR